MTDPIKRDDAPEPCPFCGCELERPFIKDLNTYRHPDNEKCFAKRAIIHPETLAAWNTRALPATNPADRIEELEKQCSIYARADQLFVEEINELEAKLTKAMEALRESVKEFDCPISSAVLAELEGK